MFDTLLRGFLPAIALARAEVALDMRVLEPGSDSIISDNNNMPQLK